MWYHMPQLNNDTSNVSTKNSAIELEAIMFLKRTIKKKPNDDSTFRSTSEWDEATPEKIVERNENCIEILRIVMGETEWC